MDCSCIVTLVVMAVAMRVVVGNVPVRATRIWSFGLVIEGLEEAHSDDYLHDVLLAPEHREAFYSLVDLEGLVVCLGVTTQHSLYRDVRGRSSKGRISQGELYHHDGCSLPTNPRIVEIRCPHQEVVRQTPTAVVPFTDAVYGMLRALPERLAVRSEVQDAYATLEREGLLPLESLHSIQGMVSRVVRREYDAEATRAYFREVDALSGAYTAPWQCGESRFIANENAFRTMQHRRAYQQLIVHGRPNGRLVKRWPVEELAGVVCGDECHASEK
jgi:hypothetical protein